MGMGFQNILERILPPKIVNGKVLKPKVTTSGGIRQDFHAPRKGRENHGGIDINYHYESGSPVGQNGINKEHPAVGSPISGKVKDTDPTGMGMVTIEDSSGNIHILMHLEKIDVNKGDKVVAGQVIGTMGGRGLNGANQYAQHVHYTIKAPDGKTNINPETYQDNSSIGKNSSSSFPWDRKTDFKHISVLDKATQQRLKNLSQGITIASGETLRREGNKIWRIERDGSTRGYFISP